MHFLLKVDLQNSILTLDGDKDVRDITGGHFIIIHPYFNIYIYIYIGIHSFLCSKYYRIKNLRSKLHKQGQHEH